MRYDLIAPIDVLNCVNEVGDGASIGRLIAAEEPKPTSALPGRGRFDRLAATAQTPALLSAAQGARMIQFALQEVRRVTLDAMGALDFDQYAQEAGLSRAAVSALAQQALEATAIESGAASMVVMDGKDDDDEEVSEALSAPTDEEGAERELLELMKQAQEEGDDALGAVAESGPVGASARAAEQETGMSPEQLAEQLRLRGIPADVALRHARSVCALMGDADADDDLQAAVEISVGAGTRDLSSVSLYMRRPGSNKIAAANVTWDSAEFGHRRPVLRVDLCSLH
jgi:hypothetical protein